MQKLRSDNFDFNIQNITIPKEPRPISEHRLLSYDSVDGSIGHLMMREIGSVLNEGDLLVFNNSRVNPVALYIEDTKFVLFIDPNHKTFRDVRVICPFKPSVGTIIELPYAKIELLSHEPGWDVYHANIYPKDDVENLHEFLKRRGQFPLPIYIQRQPNSQDEVALQGIYASVDGSIAPPVAGTHFDSQIISDLKKKGISIAKLTLHVGYGTFRSFKTEFIDDHVMDSEFYEIKRTDINLIAEALSRGNRVVAVGTTVARVLETLGQEWDRIKTSAGDIRGETDIFIKPPYEPVVVGGLITNFQYPRLPVIAMAATFVGLENLRDVYNVAEKEKYSFYSYGDAMLLRF